jgi:hypothetical protein
MGDQIKARLNSEKNHWSIKFLPVLLIFQIIWINPYESLCQALDIEMVVDIRFYDDFMIVINQRGLCGVYGVFLRLGSLLRVSFVLQSFASFKLCEPSPFSSRPNHSGQMARFLRLHGFHEHFPDFLCFHRGPNLLLLPCTFHLSSFFLPKQRNFNPSDSFVINFPVTFMFSMMSWMNFLRFTTGAINFLWLYRFLLV